jgi:transposase InsO family protein
MVHLQSKKTYGSPRIARELQAQNISVSRPRVARLMKLANIRSKFRKKYVVTTDSKHHFPVVENRLNRNFNPQTIGKAWVSDITYIKTAQGWLYLTVILDLGDRKVIGWSLSKSLKAIDTTIPAWKMAVQYRPVTKELIFHSDRGVQYACSEFTQLLNAHKNVIQSMSRKGNCWDNAVAESFFKNLKAEWTNEEHYCTTQQAAVSVFEYIETWYNTRRRHSSIHYQTPAEYENYLLTLKTAA